MKVKNLLIGIYVLLGFSSFALPKASREIYEIRVYSLKTNDQVMKLDNYLKMSYITVMHKMDVKHVGVFKVIGFDTASVKKIYVITPYKNIDQWKKLTNQMMNDQDYNQSASSFINAAADKAAYDRMEIILTEAFPLHTTLELPGLKGNKTDRVFELRSYESPTDHLFERKVTMFNKGDEIGLFKKLNFNAIFYSSVIAGPKMPNLMYMVSFESIADRDEHWKQFGNSPEWKNISTMPIYENKVSVSHIDSILMHATEYSDI